MDNHNDDRGAFPVREIVKNNDDRANLIKLKMQLAMIKDIIAV